MSKAHQGIRCELCLKKHIVGYRYKFSVCPKYNLCELCEEKNSAIVKILHVFIKLRKNQTNKDNEVNNNINNIKN